MDVIEYLKTDVKKFLSCQDKTLSALHRLGISNVAELLFHIPFRYNVINFNPPLASINQKDIVRLELEVLEIPFVSKRKNSRSPYKIPCKYQGKMVCLVYFNYVPYYLLQKLKPEMKITAEGIVDKFSGYIDLPHPKIYYHHNVAEITSSSPVYNLTFALSMSQLSSYIDKALLGLNSDYHHELIRDEYKLPSLKDALNNLHHPQVKITDLDSKNIYRKRMAFDEILAQQIAIIKLKSSRNAEEGISHKGDVVFEEKLLESLPYKLTEWQQEALSEIKQDMASGRKMMRLLQGDVGSGKTAVALMATACALPAYQVAIMAPLDILANQHYTFFVKHLETFGIRIALLTGKIKGKAREEILTKIAFGEINIIIGTHALFQEKVNFANLGLVIVDEQHRFGVMQRLEMLRKSNFTADMLLMTATPIPRTMTQAIYGDMDVSTIAHKPANRLDVITLLKPKKNINEVIESIVSGVNNGEKIFWICPLIEEAEEGNIVTSVEERYSSLEKVIPCENILFLHGRMSEEEKNDKIIRFKEAKKGMVLVSTTVIEVGIDVPDANIIVIENAEKFGISQLHQLRGRVGRGSGQSYCILLYNFTSPTGIERLQALRSTSDGFKIAELDLEMRGGGDITGFQQSGIPEFKFFNWETDKNLLEPAKKLAKEYLSKNPPLAEDLLYLFEKNASSA